MNPPASSARAAYWSCIDHRRQGTTGYLIAPGGDARRRDPRLRGFRSILRGRDGLRARAGRWPRRPGTSAALRTVGRGADRVGRLPRAARRRAAPGRFSRRAPVAGRRRLGALRLAGSAGLLLLTGLATPAPAPG